MLKRHRSLFLRGNVLQGSSEDPEKEPRKKESSLEKPPQLLGFLDRFALAGVVERTDKKEASSFDSAILRHFHDLEEKISRGKSSFKTIDEAIDAYFEIPKAKDAVGIPFDDPWLEPDATFAGHAFQRFPHMKKGSASFVSRPNEPPSDVERLAMITKEKIQALREGNVDEINRCDRSARACVEESRRASFEAARMSFLMLPASAVSWEESAEGAMECQKRGAAMLREYYADPEVLARYVDAEALETAGRDDERMRSLVEKLVSEDIREFIAERDGGAPYVREPIANIAERRRVSAGTERSQEQSFERDPDDRESGTESSRRDVLERARQAQEDRILRKRNRAVHVEIMANAIASKRKEIEEAERRLRELQPGGWTRFWERFTRDGFEHISKREEALEENPNAIADLQSKLEVLKGELAELEHDREAGVFQEENALIEQLKERGVDDTDEARSLVREAGGMIERLEHVTLRAEGAREDISSVRDLHELMLDEFKRTERELQVLRTEASNDPERLTYVNYLLERSQAEQQRFVKGDIDRKTVRLMEQIQTLQDEAGEYVHDLEEALGGSVAENFPDSVRTMMRERGHILIRLGEVTFDAEKQLRAFSFELARIRSLQMLLRREERVNLQNYVAKTRTARALERKWDSMGQAFLRFIGY